MGKDETSEPLSKKKGDKIMRKKIAALLAMLMLGGVLTGCGGGNKVATGGEDPNVVPIHMKSTGICRVCHRRMLLP